MYLKVGHLAAFEEELGSLDSVRSWFTESANGNPEAVELLKRFAQDIIKGLDVKSVTGGSCVTEKVSRCYAATKKLVSQS